MPTRTLPVIPASCHAAALVCATSEPTLAPKPAASMGGSRLTRSGC